MARFLALSKNHASGSASGSFTLGGPEIAFHTTLPVAKKKNSARNAVYGEGE
jgi:hypothetical protein